MALTSVTVGLLAFLGPPQVPTPSRFCYVRVITIDGTQVSVVVLDPEGEDEEELDPVAVGVVKRRLVGADEKGLWPGTFVGGGPITFIQTYGLDMDSWAYGVVTDYTMAESEAFLHVRCADGARRLAMRQPPNVVQVVWIDYVLQTERGTRVAALCAEALPDKLEEWSKVVRESLRKSKGYYPYRLTLRHWF
ncbi:hypothetical protein PHMEG_00012904 [Phytophthora megakarya]|uniref:Uncharacterized protein n=1 Tax=Phytophthora megakarya TaxID=4795 RepID=A0A225W947_9STRA|nr:hypothetical protein PHMEG_00012904 [Phytophthora megakarya]